METPVDNERVDFESERDNFNSLPAQRMTDSIPGEHGAGSKRSENLDGAGTDALDAVLIKTQETLKTPPKYDSKKSLTKQPSATSLEQVHAEIGTDAAQQADHRRGSKVSFKEEGNDRGRSPYRSGSRGTSDKNRADT